MGSPKNILAAIGDSLTFNNTLGVTADDFWPAQVQLALNGNGTSSVVSVSGNTLTVSPGTGAFFPVNSLVEMVPAIPGSTEVHNTRASRWMGHCFTVVSRAGDVLTLDAPPPPELIAGVPVVGRGGALATNADAGVGDFLAINVGRSGDTTAGMLGRLTAAFVLGDLRVKPAALVIQGGTNDTNAQGSTTTTGTGTNAGGVCTFTLSSNASSVVGMCGPYGSYLKVGGQDGWLMKSVSGSVVTAQPPAGTAASNVAAGTAIAVDTQNTLAQIARAALAFRIEHVFMATAPFKNFASSGNPTAPGSTTTLRDTQIAAATAAGVPVIDAWEFMRARVAAGVDTMTDTYHVAAGNVHLNAYGNSVYAMAIAAGIQATPGCMAALGAQRFDMAI